jgi:hypothetical protein
MRTGLTRCFNGIDSFLYRENPRTGSPSEMLMFSLEISYEIFQVDQT